MNNHFHTNIKMTNYKIRQTHIISLSLLYKIVMLTRMTDYEGKIEVVPVIGAGQERRRRKKNWVEGAKLTPNSITSYYTNDVLF